MSKVNATNVVVILIGLITLVVAGVALAQGSTIENQWMGMFFGIVLIGSGLINWSEWANKR